MLGLAAFQTAEAGRIVLVNDEWMLSNTGFASAGGTNAATFATNVASWFTGGGPGTFHAYSANFGLTESSLNAAMIGAGHTWTTGTGITFDLPTLQTYDGVFLAGNAASNSVLIDYVNAGGNVYLMGGTGAFGGAAGEAAAWNTFLNTFGLAFGTVYNTLASTNIAISSPHPIFSGVTQIYNDFGQETFDLAPADPRNQVLISSGGQDLYAIFDSSIAVPEPSTLLLLGTGLVGLVGYGRRKRRA